MSVQLVVKIGGSLLREPARLAQATDALNARPATLRLVVVPGGGPFANAVRDVDRAIGLDDDAAHWMAVFGMHAMAELLHTRLHASALVETPDEIERTLNQGPLPILLPYRWLRTSDPLGAGLPHSWDVTSDSIAAWVAGRLGARELILVKPIAVAPQDLLTVVDRYFIHALPLGVVAQVETPAQLANALHRYVAGSPSVTRGAAYAGDISAEGLDEL